MRFRQAKMLCWSSRNRNTRSSKIPTTVTGLPPRLMTWPTGFPLGQKVAAASLPRIATAEPVSRSSAEKARPSETA